MTALRDTVATMHEHRRREVAMIFGRCPDHVFNRALELGAGDGFQTQLTHRVAENYVSTDLSLDRLWANRISGVSYCACDAEEVGSVFAPQSFDLVFSSNLLEHLPEVGAALEGIHRILRDDGITVHAMPNRFWKASQLLFFYPHIAFRGFEKLLERIHVGLPTSSGNARHLPPNNLKSVRKPRGRWARLFPAPHGVSSTHRAEFHAFARAGWEQRLRNHGFRLISTIASPFSSGYRFGFDVPRAIVERAGIGSEYIYVAVKEGCTSPYEEFFCEGKKPVS